MKNYLPSKKQQALLEYIDGFIEEHNYAPSYREVMRALDYKSVSTVAAHINGLIERGWLVKRDNSARSVEVIYKTGQGTLPSSTSLLSTHEKWLLDKMLTRLSESTDKEHDRTAFIAALQTLGLTELVSQINESMSEQAVPTEAASDR